MQRVMQWAESLWLCLAVLTFDNLAISWMFVACSDMLQAFLNVPHGDKAMSVLRCGKWNSGLWRVEDRQITTWPNCARLLKAN